MKTVFDLQCREELIQRINSLTSDKIAQWGKMNVFQMLVHSAKCEEMLLGELKIKRVFIGKLIGKMVLNKSLKDESPFGKNSPTSPYLKTTVKSGDLEKLKKEWIGKIEQYGNQNEAGITHPFFGPMNKEQIGRFSYKHSDHHLRQFGL